MLAWVEKAQNFLLGMGGEEEDMIDEEETTEVEYKSYQEDSGASKKSNIRRFPGAEGEKVTRASKAAAEFNQEVVLARPEVVDDGPMIVDQIRNGNICVVNLEGVEKERAQRVADFLGGACYALGGHIERVSNDIFIMVPFGINVSKKLREDAKTNSGIFPWISSVR